LRLLLGATVVWRDDQGTGTLWTGGLPYARSGFGAGAVYTVPISLALQPNTTYVVASDENAALAQFTTSAVSQPTAGSPATISSLSVISRHYPPPLEESACLGCGIIDMMSIKFDAATFPDTPSSAVLYEYTLVRKGTAQGVHGFLALTGPKGLIGCDSLYPCALSPCGSIIPGDEYCAKVVAYQGPYAPGTGAESAEVCTTAVEDLHLMPDAGEPAADAASLADVGSAHADVAMAQGPDAASAGADAAMPPDATERPKADAGTAAGGSGCGCATGGGPGAVLLLTCSLLLAPPSPRPSPRRRSSSGWERET
jgi:hypothetical protein